MALTVVLNPADWGKLGVKTAVEFLNGKKAPKDVYVNHLLVDARNVERFVSGKQ